MPGDELYAVSAIAIEFQCSSLPLRRNWTLRALCIMSATAQKWADITYEQRLTDQPNHAWDLKLLGHVLGAGRNFIYSWFGEKAHDVSSNIF